MLAFKLSYKTSKKSANGEKFFWNSILTVDGRVKEIQLITLTSAKVCWNTKSVGHSTVEVKAEKKTFQGFKYYQLNRFRFVPAENLMSDKNSYSVLVNVVWVWIFISHLLSLIRMGSCRDMCLRYFVTQGNKL